MTISAERHACVDPARYERMAPEEMLCAAFETFGARAAIGTSLQKTGLVLVDMAFRLGLPIRVFFVDTQLNHPETYDLLNRVERRYAISIERFCPVAEDVESLHRSVGRYAHYLARESCCKVRKVAPLQRALDTLDVWIAGLRGDQSEHRRNHAEKAQRFSADNGRELLKLNPLLDWTAGQVDRYTREHDVPYNRLYDYVSEYGERYSVIGCQPCHIPVREALGPRAGKFPWERGKKECGLHKQGSGI